MVKDESYNDVIARLYGNIGENNQYKAIECTFQVTEACTLACTYCYQHNKSPKIMTLDIGKKFVDFIFKTYQNKAAIILDFIGGEPMLQPQLIMDIIEYWEYKCIMEKPEWGALGRYSLCTNGTCNDDPIVRQLLDRYSYRLSYTVSIDGNKELHDSARVHHDGRGSYDEAKAAEQYYISKYGRQLGSKMTIAPSNIVFMYSALKHYMNEGSKMIYANCVYEEGWTLEHARFFYQELKRLADYKLEHYPEIGLSLFAEDSFVPQSLEEDGCYCGGRGLMIACDPEGVLYPCLRYMPSSVGDKDNYITCGNIIDGLDETILNELQKCTRSVVNDTKCYFCPIGTGCGECAAYSWEVTGRIDTKVSYICDMHKARALANIYYWNKYYRQINSDKRMKNYCPENWALEIIDKEELNMLNKLTLED